MNMSPDIARSSDGRKARDILRQALIDYADASLATPEPSREPTQEQVRADFEAWIKAPPYERIPMRYPQTDATWPGSYRVIDIDLAWQAWQAAHAAGFEAGVDQRDEFKIWWERDSKSLSVALGQRDTARAVAEDNRARYAVAERQRNELAEALRVRTKQLGVACMTHDLTHALACGHCFRELAETLRRYRNEVPLGHQPHMLAYEVDAILARIDSEKAK
jgi:hypothetical protein